MKNTADTTRKFLILLLAATVFLIVNSSARAADGDLDSTFGTGGKVTTDFQNSLDVGRKAAIQSDGKIIVSGYFTVDNFMVLLRYNPNGTLDTDFDGDGKLQVTNSIRSFSGAFAVQADGKIVVTGGVNTQQGLGAFATARYNSNGSLDTSFGTNGIVVTGLANDTVFATAIVIQSDGKIVVAGIGFSPSRKFVVARYNANGTLDTSFDGDGVTTTNIPGTMGPDTHSVLLQTDGKIVVAGMNFIARYQTTGALDASFGTTGVIPTPNTASTINAATIQSDNKIIIAGRTPSPQNRNDFWLVRLNTNGTTDTTFGNNGTVTTDFLRLDDRISAVFIQPDGKIIAAGEVQSVSSIHFALARYAPNGTLDTNFGSGGKIRTEVKDRSTIFDVKLQSDGKIVAAGYADNLSSTDGDFALARYQNGGSTVVQRPHLFDFDGDFRDDFAVFRPSSGIWFMNRSIAGFAAAQWGLATDKLAPADYDGDGKTDIAVWREAAAAFFYILNSSNNTFRAEQFGTTGDNSAAVGDWDGDGKADAAVYRAGAPSLFFYRPSATSGVDFRVVNWGTTGDVPVRGDFDGDGKLDAAVFRPSAQMWFVRQSANSAMLAAQWGLASDKLVPADYDGDGKTDVAVFRPTDRAWHILQSSNSQARYQQWGLATDRLVPADYDGDGRADIAVWRDSDQNFYVLQSGGGGFSAFRFGSSGDAPIAAAFVP